MDDDERYTHNDDDDPPDPPDDRPDDDSGRKPLGCLLAKQMRMNIDVWNAMRSGLLGDDRELSAHDVVHAMAHIMAEIVISHDGEITQHEAEGRGLISDDDRLKIFTEECKELIAMGREWVKQDAARQAIDAAESGQPPPSSNKKLM